MTSGRDAVVSDAAVVDAMVTAEVALVRALAAVGAVETDVADEIGRVFGWAGPGGGCRAHGISVEALASAGVAGGNPVIPLIAAMREAASDRARPWIHRGATSQDILDTALVLVARKAVAHVCADLARAADALAALAAAHCDEPAAARTLTQHAVPTTVGARAAGWERGIRRAVVRLDDARRALPVQLGGAAGTLAAFVDLLGQEGAATLPGAFAAQLELATPEAPWHTQRWPITELGDALVQVLDALGKLAADVATLSRTEIAELVEASAGGSSAMPQKANPVSSVLIRSAAIRAPQLGATLHLAAALAVDERPDGAWHAEWPTLRELLRIALGAAAHVAVLSEGLRVDGEAVTRNLTLTGGRIVSERLGAVLIPLIGRERFAALMAADGDLAARVRELPEAGGLDVDDLLSPAAYTGLAAELSVRRPGDQAEG